MEATSPTVLTKRLSDLAREHQDIQQVLDDIQGQLRLLFEKATQPLDEQTVSQLHAAIGPAIERHLAQVNDRLEAINERLDRIENTRRPGLLERARRAARILRGSPPSFPPASPGGFAPTPDERF